MYLGHYEQQELGAMGGKMFSKLNKMLAQLAAQKAAAVEAARIKAAVEAEVARLVPTAEETAEAFVDEMKSIAPTAPVEKPTVVTPPDSLLAAPAPLTPPRMWSIPRGEVPTRMVTTPVDSIPGTAPPAAVTAAFPLQEAYRRQMLEIAARPAQDATPPGEAPPPPKKGAAIGAALLVGIPIVLAMAG